MLKIPEDKLQQFRRALLLRKIKESQRVHYEKWGRYYLDYCSKYGDSGATDLNLGNFLKKLAAKGQGKALQDQARESVNIYLSLAFGENQEEFKESEWEKQRAVEEGKMRQGGGSSWKEIIQKLDNELKLKQYSPKTRKTYVNWARRFSNFSSDQPVEGVDAETAKQFLTDLAVNRGVAASTQNQAFNALLFLFRHILHRDYELGDAVTRAKTTKYIPTVLTKSEMDRVLNRLKHPFNLIVGVLYGCGLRSSECLNLRVNCLDFDEELIIVHDGKGKKDRSVPMPKKLKEALRAQVDRVARLLDKDLETEDFGGVFLPPSMEKRSLSAAKEFGWQWLFPAKTLTLVPNKGLYFRYHNYDKNLNRAIREVVRQEKIAKRVTAHTFRHTFASHLLQANVDLRTIQQLLGHSDIKTTMIYTHTVQSRTLKEMVSPLDIEKPTHP